MPGLESLPSVRPVARSQISVVLACLGACSHARQSPTSPSSYSYLSAVSTPAPVLSPEALDRLVAQFPSTISSTARCVSAADRNKGRIIQRKTRWNCAFHDGDLNLDEALRAQAVEDSKRRAFLAAREAVFKELETLFGRLILVSLDDAALVRMAQYDVRFDQDPKDPSIDVICTFQLSDAFKRDLLSRAAAFPVLNDV